ncbi:EAL and HDOD domain-containing protein [Clostridium rectalis]|uniref:EAL and HDOD domain-containing protein n=1 Tax=Clostridium rectalis TaxID=2040295 RepID=UPI000F6402F6|nr:HDOD domain-containing protein [Clostridium rectalis]
MDVFIARQPIFNRNEKVVAYELLFRNSEENFYNNVDGNKATCDVITNGFYLIGMERLTGGKKAFINFTETLIKNEIGTILPKHLVVIEILEDVEPTEEIIRACKILKEKGYTIALDDFVFHPKYIRLLDLADIIKVDFRVVVGTERKRIIKTVNNPHIKFLAEKVETREDFNEAISYGYSYFQGYFFSKPSVVSAKDIPANKLAHLKILQELGNKEEVDFNKIENYIKMDMSILYKLFKMINSSAYGFKAKVNSIKQAMALLGVKEIYKWVYVITVRAICKDKADELLKISLIRAKFCEELAKNINMDDFDAYVTGLFSTIDVFLGQPMENIMKELPIPEDVKKALIGEENNIRVLLDLIIYYERGDFNKVLLYCKIMDLPKRYIIRSYAKAINWMAEIEES